MAAVTVATQALHAASWLAMIWPTDRAGDVDPVARREARPLQAYLLLEYMNKSVAEKAMANPVVANPVTRVPRVMPSAKLRSLIMESIMNYKTYKS